jgi:hypothetical protein
MSRRPYFQQQPATPIGELRVVDPLPTHSYLAACSLSAQTLLLRTATAIPPRSNKQTAVAAIVLNSIHLSLSIQY